MSNTRFPRSVYGVGDEPDPRFSMANERTFLAWIRTSLALLAVGIAIEALAVGLDPTLRFAAGLVFILLATVSVIHSWLSWRRAELSLRENRALPGLTMGVVLVVGVVAGTLVFVAGMLV